MKIHKIFQQIIVILFGAFLVLFSACQQINKPERMVDESGEEYDRPDEAAEFQKMRTHDPRTGEVPSDKMWTAITQTKLQKDALLNAGNFVSALTWAERGSNSDISGPYGNTRANSAVTSGRIDALWVDKGDATGKTVWIGGRGGGLWKTTDITVSPATWISVNDYMINLSIAAITQDPTDPNIMYLCTGESFNESGAIRGNGVFKSLDHGVNWSQLSSTNTSIYYYCTRILCDYQGNIYVGTRSGLFRSTKFSGGNTWIDITPSGVSNEISDLEISSTVVAGRLHVICGLSGTLSSRYTDIPLTVASGSWTSPVTALPSANRRGEIAVSGSVLYCLPGNNASPSQAPTVYKSTDGGANWVTAGSTPLTVSGTPFANGQGWYNLTVAINPADPTQCIVGGIDNAKTTNGGTTWSRISNWVGTSGQYAHADQHGSIWYDNGNKLILGNDGGIFYSSDGGTTIRDRNVGLRLKQFYSVAIHPSTTNYFLAGAQDNGTHQFTNAGLSSSVEVVGGDGAFVGIDQNEPAFQMSAYVRSNYDRSSDGGANWSFGAVDNNGLFINPLDYDNVGNRVYACYTPGNYLRWENPHAGFTYTTVPIAAFSSQYVGAVCVSPYTADRVYFGMASGGQLVKVDGANGASPTGVNISTGLPTSSVFMNCINIGSSDNFVVACYSNYSTANIWVTTNGGTSWTNVDGNLPDMPVYWAIYHPDTDSKMYIATETGVWETDLLNGASTVWTANTSFPTARATMLKYRSSDRTLAASTYGRGLWTTTIPAVTTPDVQFQLGADAQVETTVSTSDCRGYKDYTYNMTILNPPTGSGVAIATFGVAGGTATQNVDYAVITPSVSFAVGINPPQPFTIRIYDDGALESAETFTLNYSLAAGSTNAQVGVSNQTMTITINDNDVGPITSSSITGSIGAITYDLIQTTEDPLFNSRLASKRTQMLFKASELTAAGLVAGPITSMQFNIGVKASTRPFAGLTIKMGGTTQAQLVNGSFTSIGGLATVKNPFSYSTIAGYNTFTFDASYTWNGTDNLAVEVCYNNVTADAAQVSDHTYGYTDGSAVAIGNFVWQDGINCASAFGSVNYFGSGVKPVIKLSQVVAGTAFSTALSSTKTAYLGPFDDVYFYDASGNILARIKNNTSFDYGCTQVVIDRAGSTSSQFWNAIVSNYPASKSYKVIPTNNTTTGNYQVTLYYTAAEVGGYNAAAAPSTFASSPMIKVSNGFFIPDVTSGTPHLADTYVSSGTVAAFGSIGSTATATFNNTGFSGFGFGTVGNSLLTADYRSKSSGNYSDIKKWEYNPFSSIWADANQAPTAGSNVNILAAHTIALDAAQTVSTGKTLTVNGTFTAGTNTVSGAGAFTLAAGATFATSNTGANGISQNITVSGTKTFTDGANYTFNGASTAPFGSNFTTVRPDNVAVGANITLDKSVYITGVLGFIGSSRVLTTGSNLTLGSTISGTARIADMTKDFFTAAVISGNSIAGTATVERYIANAGHRAWHLLSGKAVTGARTVFQEWQESGSLAAGYGTWITSTAYVVGNGFDATNNNLSSIATHNQAGPSWVYTMPNTNSTILSANQGYMLFVRGDRNYTATLPTSSATSATTLRTNGTLTQGTQSALSVVSTGTGRTLVGNPFASPIDFESIQATTNLVKTFYVWDATLTGNNGVGGFVLVDRNGGTYQTTPEVMGGTTVNPNSRYIHSGQAFFLRATGGTANLVFNEASKASSVSAINPIVNGIGEQQMIVNLMIANPGGDKSLADGIRVKFDDSYSTATADDDEKMGNFAENLSSYRDNKKLIVERRPMIVKNDTVFLYMTNTGIKDYRLQLGAIDFVQTGIPAKLEDTYLGTSRDIDLNGSITNYDFSVTADAGSAASSRFRIVFGKAAVIMPGITAAGINIFPNPVTGRNIGMQFNDAVAGVYQLRLINSTGQVVLIRSIKHGGASTFYRIDLNRQVSAGSYRMEIIRPDNTRTTLALVIGK